MRNKKKAPQDSRHHGPEAFANQAISAGTKPDDWQFLLYVTQKGDKSRTLVAKLQKIFERHLAQAWGIEVVDVLQHPQRAFDDDVIATPCLVRKAPLPERRIIGALTNSKLVCSSMKIC